jgi:hypothetical protein
VTERQLAELDRSRRGDAYDALERDVLRYAEAMTRTPVAVPDELFARCARGSSRDRWSS